MVPPSTTISAAVIPDAPFDARNTTASATSSAAARRPIGIVGDNLSSVPSSVAPARAPRVQIGVRVAPGITVFTRIPRCTSSVANTFAMPVIPALDAEYAADPALPSSRMTEPLSTIDPPADISGSAAWTVRKTAVRLVRRIASNAAAVVPPSGVDPEIPALANTISSEPKASLTCLIIESSAAGSSRSA